jgi:hypothetical protein
MLLSAPAARADLGFRGSYKSVADALTTEKAWALDRAEPNPHRQRWLLGRKVELKELMPRELKIQGSLMFGVTTAGLEAESTAYFRGEGPWYRPLREFPCEAEPASWFATEEGSRIAAALAAKSWDRMLEQQRLPLFTELKRLIAPTPGAALEKARLLFEGWRSRVDAAWRLAGKLEARKAEWKSYEQLAREQGICGGKKVSGKKPKAGKNAGKAGEYDDEYVPTARRRAIPWEMMMEPPATGASGRAGAGADESKLLARAPAKTWDGLFSVRLNLTIGARKLNGTFLIDSGSGTSIISPDFLNGQGILPAWIAVPGAPFRRIPWGGSGVSGEGGLAPVVAVDRVELGNTQLELTEFALFDTEFFSQPDHPSSCCDGVLGSDFLRRYVVELAPGPPSEVKLWPAENFHVGPDTIVYANNPVTGEPLPPSEPAENPVQWFEAALTPGGDPVSACIASRPGHAPSLAGVRWDTGRENALYVHLPWQAAARAGRPTGWDIRCGPATEISIANDVPATFVKPDGTPESAAIRTRVPAFTIGMELLSRGRVFFDLPHGRIWFPDRTSEAPLRRDRSGLVVQYEFIKSRGDARALIVKDIKKGSPAEALRKRGLRPGMVISQIEKIDAENLDEWKVKRYFAGVYGERVYVQWKTPKGLMLGQMKVR